MQDEVFRGLKFICYQGYVIDNRTSIDYSKFYMVDRPYVQSNRPS